MSHLNTRRLSNINNEIHVPEILTRLEDEVITDEKWEIKVFHVWTVPVDGRVLYNFLLFQKGGLVYKSSVRCVFSKCGDSDVLFLNKVRGDTQTGSYVVVTLYTKT